MSRHPIFKQSDYLDAARVFHWATRDHFVMWFTGTTDRHRRTEVVLPRLVARGKLKAYKWGTMLVYSVPSRCRGKQVFIEHGLGCTEGLVRIWRSKMDCLIIPERYFKGFGNVPEWGIKYPNGKLLLFEFCTRVNFEKPGLVKGKIARYKDSMPAIVNKFGGEAVGLIVADVSREAVKRFVEEIMPEGEFFFTDYQTFFNVPIGQQLKAPIYIWGENGQPYSLREND